MIGREYNLLESDVAVGNSKKRKTEQHDDGPANWCHECLHSASSMSVLLYAIQNYLELAREKVESQN